MDNRILLTAIVDSGLVELLRLADYKFGKVENREIFEKMHLGDDFIKHLSRQAQNHLSGHILNNENESLRDEELREFMDKLQGMIRARRTLDFPLSVMSGISGEFAKLYSQYLESPAPFFYFSFLTCLGSLLSDRLSSELEIKPQPRFYTVLIGESADDRKSTAASKTIEFFRDTFFEGFHVCYGVGSAEGLQEKLSSISPSRLLLFCDEFKSFVDKCSIKGSVLLPCVNTLFESNRYESQTRNSCIKLENAYLSILAATTKATFETMWSSNFTSIGFNNRIFLVTGSGKRKYAMPEEIPESLKKNVRYPLNEMVSMVNPYLKMHITDQARNLFQEWYLDLDQSIHAKRIDTMAHRLLPVLAINDKKTQIDKETVEKAIVISNWQLEVRKELDPIDADNVVAKMEERIRRHLRKRPMTFRELRQNTSADKYGIWVLETALKNLRGVEEVTFNTKSKEFRIHP